MPAASHIPPRPPRNWAVYVMAASFVLAIFLNGAFTVWSVQNYQSQSRRQSALIELKICSTLNRLASLSPPAGNPLTNPSRAYLQDQHARLDELSGDLGCRT